MTAAAKKGLLFGIPGYGGGGGGGPVTAPSLTNPGDRYVARNQTIAPITIANSGGAASSSITSGTLPTGLSFSNGTISGTVDGVATVEVVTIEVTFTNGAGSSAVTFDIDVRASFTEVDSLDTFPMNLNTADELYVVTESITVDGSVFAITATGVALDLGGNTITYNNATPITVANYSFEDGTGTTPDNWDLTNAPNAERFAGSYILNQVRDGSYSLRFTDTTATEYAENDTDIVLDANTTYILSAMVEYGGKDVTNPGVKMYAQLVGDSLTTIEASYSGTNFRGMLLVESEFTTGGTPETRTVRVGIVGHASATDDVYIDSVTVNRCRTFGVALPQNAGYLSAMADIAVSGTATGATITNGTIAQGQDGGSYCDGIKIFNNSGITVDHCTITVAGNNTSCINGQDTGTDLQTITNNTLTSNATKISRRDYFDGAVVLALPGTITDNVINNGPHAGIVPGVGSSASTIARNTITLSSTYTNGFAIIPGPGSSVFSNTITAYTGSYQCRGISVTSGIDSGNTTKVYSNTIAIQQLANNQEFQGSQIGGAYGLQIEGSSDTEVYSNTVTVYGNDGPGYAMRIGPNPVSNNKVHDNTFRAVRTVSGDAARAGCVAANNVEPSEVEFYDNDLTTNDVLIDATVSEFTLLRSHITGETAVGDAYPFVAQYSGGTGVHVNATFADTTFEDASSQTYFDEAVPVNYVTKLETNRFQFNKAWTTTIHAQDSGDSSDVVGATVVVDDAEATEVVNTTTDANGDVSAILNEWKRVGSTETALTPHDITITATGYQEYTGQQTVDALNETHTASLEAEVITALGGGLMAWGFTPINLAAYQHSNKAMTTAGNYVAQIFEVPKSGTIDNLAVTIAAVTSAQDITIGLETVGTDGLPSGSAYGGSVAGSVTGAYTAGNKLVALGTSATATRGDRVALVVRWSSTAGSITVATLSGNSAACGFPYVAVSGTQSRDTCVCGVEYSDGTWPAIAGGFPANDLTTTTLNIDDDASGPEEAGLLFQLPAAVRAHGLCVFCRPLGTTDTFQCHIRSVVDGSTLGTALASTASINDNQTSATSFIHGHFFLFTSAVELAAATDYRLVIEATGSRTTDIQLGVLGDLVEAAAIEQLFNANSSFTQWDGSSWTDTGDQVPMMALIIDGI